VGVGSGFQPHCIDGHSKEYILSHQFQKLDTSDIFYKKNGSFPLRIKNTQPTLSTRKSQEKGGQKVDTLMDQSGDNT
jgi:hypothetical protein